MYTVKPWINIGTLFKIRFIHDSGLFRVSLYTFFFSPTESSPVEQINTGGVFSMESHCGGYTALQDAREKKIYKNFEI
jgi:hypothetical protein